MCFYLLLLSSMFTSDSLSLPFYSVRFSLVQFKCPQNAHGWVIRTRHEYETRISNNTRKHVSYVYGQKCTKVQQEHQYVCDCVHTKTVNEERNITWSVKTSKLVKFTVSETKPDWCDQLCAYVRVCWKMCSFEMNTAFNCWFVFNVDNVIIRFTIVA